MVKSRLSNMNMKTGSKEHSRKELSPALMQVTTQHSLNTRAKLDLCYTMKTDDNT